MVEFDQLTEDEWNDVCRAAGAGHSADACDALKVAVERIIASRLRYPPGQPTSGGAA